MNPITHTFHESPIGKLLLRQENAALTGLWITGEAHAPTPAPDWAWSDAGFAPIRAELDTYFAGRLPVFTIPIAFTSGTAFQRAVWEELARIPYGHTISYGELGRRIGRPAAVRAIGSANGQNPVSIVIPCHRVIGANGTLTGYGGGLPAKRWLLAHEATHAVAALL